MYISLRAELVLNRRRAALRLTSCLTGRKPFTSLLITQSLLLTNTLAVNAAIFS
jgi:hypothetical protein